MDYSSSYSTFSTVFKCSRNSLTNRSETNKRPPSPHKTLLKHGTHSHKGLKRLKETTSSKPKNSCRKMGSLYNFCFTASFGGQHWRQDTRLETSLVLIPTGNSEDNIHNQHDIVTLLLMAKLASHTCILFINTAFVKEIQYDMFPAKVWCKKLHFHLNIYNYKL